MKEPAQHLNLYTYESEVSVILTEAESHPSRETGGDLYGSFTHSDMPIAWLISGPGPSARGTHAEFQQDAAFTTEWQRRLHQLFGIQYIGGWHSHHTLGLNQPSSGDIRVAQEYALRHNRRRNVEIIVTLDSRGKAVLWPYVYFNAPDGQFLLANLMLLEGDSPLRSRLGSHEIAFSARPSAHSRSPHIERLISQNARPSDLPHIGSLEGYKTAIPEVLDKEVSSLHEIGLQDVSVECRDSLYLLSIDWKDCALAIALEIPRWGKTLKIMKIHLIDKPTGTNSDLDVLTEGRLHVKGKKLQGQTLAEICAQVLQ